MMTDAGVDALAPSQAEVANTPAHQQVFRREGEYWTVAYGGQVCRFKSTKGFWHLAELLASPGTRIAATSLVDSAGGAGEGGRAGREEQSLGDSPLKERARVNVTRALSATLKRIAAHHPSLGKHFETTVRTGAFCAYLPDDRLPSIWDL